MLKKTFLIRRLPLQRTDRNGRWLSCVPNNVHVDLTQQFPYVVSNCFSWLSIPEWKTMCDQRKATLSRYFPSRKAPCWVNKSFSFWYWNSNLYVWAVMGVSIYVETGDQIRGGAVIGCPSAWHSRHLERLSHTLNPAGKIICHCTLG